MAQKDNKTPKMPKFNPYWIYGIVAVALIFISTMGSSSAPQSLAYGTFEKKLLGRDGIAKIVIIRNELKAEVTLNVDSVDNYRELFANEQNVPTSGPHFIVDIPSIDSFEASRKAVEEARHKEIVVYYEQRTSFFGDILSVIWPILLMVILYVVLFRRMAGGGGAGIFSVGKSQAKMVDKDSNVNVTFKDVAGLSGAKEELEEIVEFLRHPEKYTGLGGKIPKGALLVGPPGT
ncbi:MAG: cell division protein FtsH, partial [Bacteroidales bacterium]|nr:cell division protein FtsH [Bacteroidales bacterium]